MNGAPPIFQSAKVSGEIQLVGLPEDGEEDAVRQALADLLGVDVAMIVLRDEFRRKQRRQKRQARTFSFEIVGDSKTAAALASDLTSSNLADKLSSHLSNEFNMSIATTFGSGVKQVTEDRPEGEVWEEVGGEYWLRECPKGCLVLCAMTRTLNAVV